MKTFELYDVVNNMVVATIQADTLEVTNPGGVIIFMAGGEAVGAAPIHERIISYEAKEKANAQTAATK